MDALAEVSASADTSPVEVPAVDEVEAPADEAPAAAESETPEVAEAIVEAEVAEPEPAAQPEPAAEPEAETPSDEVSLEAILEDLKRREGRAE